MNVLERAVLGLLLEHYPAHLSTAEIVLAMTTRPEDIAERDTIETALTSLRGYGLVHSVGSFWFPTLAATRFDALGA